MTLTTSQKINEIKRSFHKYLADSLSGVQIDFDDKNFTPPDDEAFLVIRYTRSERETSGIGGVVTGDSPNIRGNWHRIEVNLSIYKRDDAQKADIGELHDDVADLLKVGDIPLYDFTDPENPQEAGKIYIDPLPAGSGPSPVEGRLTDHFMKRELIEAGFAWIGFGLTLSVLEEY
jgi:hypothetical protein